MSSVTILLSSLSNGILSNRVRLKICNISYKLADKLSHFLTMATITTAADIRKNRALILRFTKAYIEGIHRVKTDKEFAINVLAKSLRTSDRDALEETYRAFSTLFEKVPYPAPEGVESILEELHGQTPKANNLRPEDFVDSSFVRELEKSGFINNLYR